MAGARRRNLGRLVGWPCGWSLKGILLDTVALATGKLFPTEKGRETGSSGTKTEESADDSEEEFPGS